MVFCRKDIQTMSYVHSSPFFFNSIDRGFFCSIYPEFLLKNWDAIHFLCVIFSDVYITDFVTGIAAEP
jgi:hypothetical protein